MTRQRVPHEQLTLRTYVLHLPKDHSIAGCKMILGLTPIKPGISFVQMAVFLTGYRKQRHMWKLNMYSNLVIQDLFLPSIG